jgi:hypothetical protein
LADAGHRSLLDQGRGEVRLGKRHVARRGNKKLFRGVRLEALFKAEARFSALTDDEIARLPTLSKITSTE